MTDIAFFSAADNEGLFQALGFETCPVNPKGQKQLIWPETAPSGQHPSGFLQFGVCAVNFKHYFLEMGDHTALIRLDLKENTIEGYNNRTIFQLDEVHIWNGPDQYRIDCGKEFYRPYTMMTCGVVKRVIENMGNWDYEGAKTAFQDIYDVTDDLDQARALMVSEQNAQRLAARLKHHTSNTP